MSGACTKPARVKLEPLAQATVPQGCLALVGAHYRHVHLGSQFELILDTRKHYLLKPGLKLSLTQECILKWRL